ncbi:unnamed protein product [Pleuronectes platessa]|uniref:Uncharacterized protein n=1 Tax=Pleuronectes platessa TaxID=8262 RepID=A0A9N7YHC8_PLEPL|nr:unnamed protein product [Pleuronectes platessa]
MAVADLRSVWIQTRLVAVSWRQRCMAAAAARSFHACLVLLPHGVMAQQATARWRYVRAFVSGLFVAVPVTVTVLDRLAYVARVEGASMQVRHDHNVHLHQSELSASALCEVNEMNGSEIPHCLDFSHFLNTYMETNRKESVTSCDLLTF